MAIECRERERVQCIKDDSLTMDNARPHHSTIIMNAQRTMKTDIMGPSIYGFRLYNVALNLSAVACE